MPQIPAPPDPVTDHLLTLLRRDLAAFEAEVQALHQEADLWEKAPGATNAVGNLALHVAGNLQHFVGCVPTGSGYVRNRADEFARSSGSSADVMGELQKAKLAVDTVLPKLTTRQLAETFPVSIDGQSYPPQVFLLRLRVHLAFCVFGIPLEAGQDLNL